MPIPLLSFGKPGPSLPTSSAPSCVCSHSSGETDRCGDEEAAALMPAWARRSSGQNAAHDREVGWQARPGARSPPALGRLCRSSSRPKVSRADGRSCPPKAATVYLKDELYLVQARPQGTPLGWDSVAESKSLACPLARK